MRRKSSALWLHLDSLGILETGTPEEIDAAKRAYWKAYHYNHRKAQRKDKPEVVIALSREDGTYERISTAAKKHRMTVAAFIRASAVAYLTETYIVPDRAVIVHLEQLLSQSANQLQAVAGVKEKYFWQREHKIESMEAQISKLEQDIRELLRNPPRLDQEILKALKQKPDMKAHLLDLITTHDSQDKIKKE